MHLWDPRAKLADRRQQVKNASLLGQCPARVPLDSPDEVSRQKTRSKEGCLLTQAMQVAFDSRYEIDPEKQDGAQLSSHSANSMITTCWLGVEEKSPGNDSPTKWSFIFS